LKIIPGKLEVTQSVNTHGDHRIAMAFASLSMKTGLKIEDENVVAKSYPEFWDQLKEAGLNIHS
jgi:3-phosphoshikimate 1-carboxyvinyltransferase